MTSLQANVFKWLDFGSSGRIRTYNPSVNSIVPGLCTSVFQCYRLLITRMLRVPYVEPKCRNSHYLPSF
jgi:hypothetical protein